MHFCSEKKSATSIFEVRRKNFFKSASEKKQKSMRGRIKTYKKNLACNGIANDKNLCAKAEEKVKKDFLGMNKKLKASKAKNLNFYRFEWFRIFNVAL